MYIHRYDESVSLIFKQFWGEMKLLLIENTINKMWNHGFREQCE